MSILINSYSYASGSVDPIELVANVAASAGSGVGLEATTTGIDTTGATLLVRADVVYDSFVNYQFTDSKGNTWVGLTQYGGGGSTAQIRLSYVKNPVVGAAHTFTGGNGATAYYHALCVAAFNLTDTTADADGDTGANAGAGLTLQPGSLTPATSNALIVSAFGYFDQPSARGCSVNSGLTVTDNSLNALNACAALGYVVQTSAAAVNPTWTAPINQYGLAAAMTAFKHA